MKSLKKRNLFIAGYASLMMVCSTSVNGQQGVLLPQSRNDHHVNEVEPRRWPPSSSADTIGGPGKVGNTFGAGESSAVNARVVAWPQNAPATPLDEIKVGSDYSKNAVIGIYDNNGETAGDLENVRIYNKQEGTYLDNGVGSPDATNRLYFPSDSARISITVSTQNSPSSTYGALRMYIPSISYVPEKDITNIIPGMDPGYFYSFVTANTILRPALINASLIPIELHFMKDVSDTYIGSLYYPCKDPTELKYYIPMHTHVRRWLPIETFTFSGVPADTLYTTTRNVSDKFDDGQPLLYSHNGNYEVDSDRDKFDSTLTHVNTQYLRPTTVLLSGSNRLNSITVGDVEWYAAYLYGEEQGLDSVVEYVFNPNNGGLCNYFSGWVSYERKKMGYNIITPPYDFAASGRYVDAAVRLLDKADVSVQGDVLDATTTYHSLHDTTDITDTLRTNAILVLPGKDNSLGERSNFRLKIGGDATLLHTQDSGAYNPVNANPLEDGYLYSYWGKGGAGAIFPLSQDSIYLSAGTGSGTDYYDEVFFLSNYDHPRETRTLTDFTGDPDKNMPYSRTYASVYGVKGNYHGNTPIFTRTYAKNDTTGIIEIGPATRGQDSLKIYSSGMLKNFRSDYYPQADTLTVGVADTAPGFNLSNNFMPLYIINDGTENNSYEPDAGIWFNKAGVDSINAAIANATGSGDLHIQANSFVKFNGSSGLNLSLKEDNEVKILSDGNGIYVQENLTFDNADKAHLTLWTKGHADANRGIMPASGQTGAIQIGKSVTAAYDKTGGTSGDGLILLRSEEDDVLVGETFTFDNQHANPGSGELMVQAGQDIRIDRDVTLTQKGQRSMLFEAQKTAYFGSAFNVTRDGVSNGDLTVKAGYQGLLLTADVNAFLNWSAGACVTTGGYLNYKPDQQASETGGDIWFGGPVRIKLTPATADSVDTYIRAYNSIYLNDSVTHSLTSAAHYTSGSEYADTTLLYAETGNIEAHSAGDVTFNISGNDSTHLLLQAGNVPGDPYAASSCLPADNEWKGNILFHENKTLAINHEGTGPTLISASRDIENQEGAGFTFTYGNGTLGDKDNLLITAGRHIEAHASYTFNYTTTTAITNDITMQAGHLAGGSDDYLPKATELASNPKNANLNNNANKFAIGGEGHGSILLFDSVTYNYPGQGTILMTALNGNIESDPYLHGAYPNAAPVVFNHKGTGITRLEAIDIKLHDRLEYSGTSDIEIFAFDSILTRSLTYNNTTGTGSMHITANKLKRNVSGAPDYNTSTGGPGIHQGHIVLGYGADAAAGSNASDSIVFNFKNNTNDTGANVYIRAGYDGFDNNPVTGKSNSSNLFKSPDDAGKAYGGNITFDYIKADMAEGNHTAGGYMEISTPNGNIWGKDSIGFNALNGDLLVDAGLGSQEDILRAARWNTFPDYSHGNGQEPMLNTCVPLSSPESGEEWRTGNIMMKGAMITFNNGTGNATFRTREGYIDTYDAFTAADMEGHILKYAGMDDAAKARRNNWGDVSERDFQYTPSANSGSVFFGADDNIMLNYGNSNFRYSAYGNGSMGYPGNYDPQEVNISDNPFYYTSYEGYISDLPASTFNVNKDGYLFYRNPGYTPNRRSHLLYRGCTGADCSGVAGECNTTSNGARNLTFDYRNSISGGIASVASNYIDLFTGFEYHGGQGSGLHAVPGKTHLHGEPVAGYGLYIKSQFNSEGKNQPEKRRATCEDCNVSTIGGGTNNAIPEMTYIGFHDNARIHTNRQKSLLEAPVIEFFGHAELDSETDKGSNTKITLKGDSLIFHDSVIFDGSSIDLIPFTTDAAQRANDMRYGVINDHGKSTANYSVYGPAIAMADRGLPVLELGYQRCTEPGVTLNSAPNARSKSGYESTPTVGGDVVVAFKHGYTMPVFNSVVANNARISFTGDLFDGVTGGEYVDAFIRTDLLRIRNKVEFYTDPLQPVNRSGKLVLATPAQMDDQMADPGMYTRHLHTEPGSELSIPGEDSLIVIETAVLGGYGCIHENVFVKANGILAPGYASLMEGDCQTPGGQGTLTVQNLQMEKDAVLRISINQNRETVNGEQVYRTKADMIVVKNVFLTNGRVPLVILPEMETLEPGYYPIITYGDSSGVSRESMKNLVLTMQRYEGNYYALDFSEDGMVGLSVTDFPVPDVQRYVDLPTVEGVTTVPESFRHYVSGNKDFIFTATFTGTPLKVTATGFYSARTVDLDKTAKILGNNYYEYTIYRVVEPWTIHIGPNASTVLSDVSNEFTAGRRVWAYRNTLYINAEKEDVISIYNMTGVMNNRVDIPEGMTTLTLERGIYVVKLKDGSTHRIIIQ